MRKQSPYLAFHVLVAFERRLCNLTQEAYDEAFDEITEFLGRCNNESHRLVSFLPGEAGVP